MKFIKAKGTKDYLPEEQIMRNKIINVISSMFEVYGFNSLETPIIERLNVLAAKFTAGIDSDAMNEVFKVSDQGNRKLGLRYDLTVPFSRFIAENPGVKLPFKRYAIGKVFRDGPVKLGRLREFLQLDGDVVGVKSVKADLELIILALDVFKKLNLNAYIEVNNKKLLIDILNYSGIDEKYHEEVIIVIDKLKKIGLNKVNEELKKLGIIKTELDKLNTVFNLEGTPLEVINELSKLLIESEGLNEIKELFSLIDNDKVVLNLALARGLLYYTGTVFEGFAIESEVTSSICGGGRYDNMISNFIGTKKEYPATGISFGMEPIFEVIKEFELNDKKTTVELYVIPINVFDKTFELVRELRNEGIKCDIDLKSRGVSKNLIYANYYKIPYVLFVGEDELSKNKFKLRNMISGDEKLLTKVQLIKFFK